MSSPRQYSILHINNILSKDQCRSGDTPTYQERRLPLQIKPISSSEFFSNVPSETHTDILYVAHFLKEHYGAKCYIVGGAVRDHLLDRECRDYDIECYGISPELFKTAMERLGAEGVGRSFFVYKYHQLDIALPRMEKKVGRGHRGFDVTLATEEREASRRRDFTINALMYDIEGEQILDYWQGLADLDRKMLRVIDKVSFAEDSLRVLRAMQFAARFGLRVEAESCEVCRQIPLDDLPKERLFLEFEKMFKGTFPSYGLYYFLALGIAQKLFSIEMDRQSFVSLCRQFLQSKKNFLEKLKPYYFLYIATPYFDKGRREILDKLGAPRIYYKKIADVPLLPEIIDCAFVARTAHREGIAAFVGNYHPRVKMLAHKLDVWGQPFDSGVVPAVLMAEGFEGKALGDELARRTEKKIRDLDNDCIQ